MVNGPTLGQLYSLSQASGVCSTQQRLATNSDNEDAAPKAHPEFERTQGTFPLSQHGEKRYYRLVITGRPIISWLPINS